MGQIDGYARDLGRALAEQVPEVRSDGGGTAPAHGSIDLTRRTSFRSSRWNSVTSISVTLAPMVDR
jgi:hypothetical protein